MLIFSILSIILATAVNNNRDSSILFSRISILSLCSTFYIFFVNIDWIFTNKGIILYNGLFMVKNTTYIFILFILILTIFILSLNSFLFRKYMKSISSDSKNTFVTLWIKNTKRQLNWMANEYRIIEYPLIILFCISGAIFVMCSYDLISLFLSIELQSYALYLLCSIHRNSESSLQGGLTYFLLGSISSCIILLGISLLYINTGNTSLENIYMITSLCNSFSNIYYDNSITNTLYTDIFYIYTQIQLPLIIMSVGFLFKISAAPFHFWSPDVYDAIPTNVTAFVAIIAKISLLIILYELAFNTDSSLKNYSWLNNIILSAFFSLIIGSLLGLIQSRIKRLLAYSTISHVGFILLALSINTIESSRSFFFYILQYSISNLNLFIIILTIGYSLYSYVLKKNNTFTTDNYSPVQYLIQLQGYFFINPMISISLIITLFSFVGIPPLIGFFGKQMILTSAIDQGYIFIVFIAILTSVISAVYYLVLVKIIFFEQSIYKFKNNSLFMHMKIPSHLSISISLITLFILCFIFFDQEFSKLLNLIL